MWRPRRPRERANVDPASIREVSVDRARREHSEARMLDCRPMAEPRELGEDPVETVLRSSARRALWASLLMTAALALAFLRWMPSLPPAHLLAAIEADQDLFKGADFAAREEVRLLQDYVRIDTAHPDPDELAAARFLADWLARFGLRATIDSIGDRRANLWVLVEGRRPEAIVLHSHIDVEPAAPEDGWRTPPFAATIDGPWIYGRGIYDMKSLAVAQLLALRDLATRPDPPERSVLLLATSGEEIGSELGTRRILARHPELVRRMAVVLTEGGVVEAVGPREVKYWGIEFAQKRYARIDLRSRDRARLLEVQTRLRKSSRSEPVLPLSPPVKAFLEEYAPTRSAQMYRRQLADPDATYRDPTQFARLSPFLKSLGTNEVLPFGLESMAAGDFRMQVYFLLLPGSDPAEEAAKLLPESLTHGLERSPLEVLGADATSPLDFPPFALLANGTREAHPEVAVGPYFLPWAATDARFFRAHAIPTYGYSPFLIPVTDTLNIGHPNERMALPGFVAGVALYRQVVARLADDTSSEW